MKRQPFIHLKELWADITATLTEIEKMYLALAILKYSFEECDSVTADKSNKSILSLFRNKIDAIKKSFANDTERNSKAAKSRWAKSTNSKASEAPASKCRTSSNIKIKSKDIKEIQKNCPSLFDS